MSELAPDLARAASAVAQRLREAGQRGWIVGGAVRDLALERPVEDIDMVSAARPEEVERLFGRTVSVGRAFGIVVVLIEGCQIELATLRRERGYSDARRPDEVHYTSSVEEDALRRDFTCNAIYLDPLTDEVRDPAGGVADLRAGLLRTVGEARERFAEDGLRLLRMARFEGAMDLRPVEGLHEAARAARAALSGVSPERVLDELSKVFEGPRMGTSVAAAFDCDLFANALPGWEPGPAARKAVFEHLPDPCGAAMGLAALLEARPLDPERWYGAATGGAASLEVLDALHPARNLRNRIKSLWQRRGELPSLLEPGCKRSQRVRALREEMGESALVLESAWRAALAAPASERQALADLAQWWAQIPARDRTPAALVSSGDLEALGVERGPLWGELLRAAEDAQLDGEVHARDEALAWLARAAQVGGQARRNRNETG